MIRSSLIAIQESLSGTLFNKDGRFCGVSIDTRTLVPGNVYVAISGDNFDGHTFCDSAIENGASAIIVERQQDVSVPQLVVESCREALTNLAIFWRDQFDIPLVAITGSSGKTTVKEMVSAIFRQVGPTLATAGNLNNELGVPLTLLRLSRDHKHAVIEIGANHVGEIEQIVNYVRPTIAVITMIGPSHLQGFGSIEAIASAKSEIFSGLQKNGIAVINRDDAFFETMRDATENAQLTFGGNSDASIQSETIEGTLSLDTPSGSAVVNLALLGSHNKQNALAATAVAIASNIDLENIVCGLESVTAVPGRLQIRLDIKNYQIIDDTYNANPASVLAAIDVLDDLPGNNCLVLGDMAELGTDAVQMHENVGEYAAKVNKQLLCTGSYSKFIAMGYGEKSVVYQDMDSLFSAFCQTVKRGSNVLVKGSRSAGMERFIEKIKQREESSNGVEENSL